MLPRLVRALADSISLGCVCACVNSALLVACQQLLDSKTAHSRNTGTELSIIMEQANLETPACV